MTPSPTFSNARYGSGAYAKSTTCSGVAFGECQNLLNVAICQLREVVFFSGNARTVFNVILSVFLLRRPSQICGAVIRTATISMGDYMRRGWFGAVESLANQYVNKLLSAFSARPHIGNKVADIGWLNLLDAPRVRSAATVINMATPNPAKVADFVMLAFNRSPFLNFFAHVQTSINCQKLPKHIGFSHIFQGFAYG